MNSFERCVAAYHIRRRSNMNEIEYVQKVACGLTSDPEKVGADVVQLRDAMLTLLANESLFHLMQSEIDPQRVVDYIKHTIEEFTGGGMSYFLYTGYILALLSNPLLHRLVLKYDKSEMP